MKTGSEYKFRDLMINSDHFENGTLYYAMAPGRLDLMGGIADYSGSLVLQATIDDATWVAVQKDRSHVIKIETTQQSADIVTPAIIELDKVVCKSSADYPRVQRYFKDCPSKAWAAYVAGVISVLTAEKGTAISSGLRVLVHSTVPLAAGVSSSASLEVAAMLAIGGAFGIHLEQMEIAILCQKVENFIAGAPCGIMDQVAVALGKQNQLLKLKCDPHNLKGYTTLPDDLTILGIHSGVRHSVGGGDYGLTRTSAFMGLGILQSEGVAPSTGYIADFSRQQFLSVKHRLPLKMQGKDYLQTGFAYPDNATKIDPEKEYHIRNAAEHPVYENFRVQQFCRILEDKPGNHKAYMMAGKLMYASHWSYSQRAKLGSSQTDKLVSIVRKLGPKNGFYGAKITGGGCGGTVAVLANKEHSNIQTSIVNPYENETGCKATVISCGGPGALEYGVRSLVKES